MSKTSTFAFICLLLGTKLMLIDYAGGSVPLWDQWDAEALYLLIPWLDGSLTWEGMFAAHNEHRIFLTRALVLGLFELNSQWDPLVEIVFNAFLSISCLLLLLHIITKLVADRTFVVSVAVLAGLLWLIPFGWQNATFGFQSQFYFMVLLTLGSIYGCLCFAPLSTQWWLGIASLLVIPFAMASGVLATCVIFAASLGMAGWSYLLKKPSGPWLTTLSASTVILVLNYLLRVEFAPHDFLKAKDVTGFLYVATKSLSWPWIELNTPFVILYLPLAMLFILILAERRLPNKAELFVVILGGWVVLQGAAMGYARGGTGSSPVSRYMDLLMLGPIACFSALYLLSRLRLFKNHLRTLTVFCMAWGVLLLAGSIDLVKNSTLPSIQDKRKNVKAQSINIASYLRDNNQSHLRGKTFREVPYPGIDRLIKILDNEKLQTALPVGLRPPIDITDNSISQNFGINGYAPGTKKPENTVMGSYSDSPNQSASLFKSPILNVNTKYLLIDIAGNLSDPKIQMHLETSDGLVITVDSSGTYNDWHTIMIGVPDDAFRIVIEDRSDENWLAISNVRPQGQLTYLAKGLISKSRLFFYLPLVYFFCLLFYRPLKQIFETNNRNKIAAYSEEYYD